MTRSLVRATGSDALRACEAAARLVGTPHRRGELLDRAALAARELGCSDLAKRLEAAWRAASTLARLARYLVADGDARVVIRKKAARALTLCPGKDSRQIGFLHVLTGDMASAAAVLSKAPGLGWSSAEHPGHNVFPALVILSSNQHIGDEFAKELEATVRDPYEGPDVANARFRLGTPSLVELLGKCCRTVRLSGSDRDAMIDGMRVAAEKRLAGILGNSRRRHYAHAASLMAACVATAPAGRRGELRKWASDLHQQYWRRHAFRQEFSKACERLNVSLPT